MEICVSKSKIKRLIATSDHMRHRVGMNGISCSQIVSIVGLDVMKKSISSRHLIDWGLSITHLNYIAGRF
jgi:hypothetical protein